MAIAHSNELLPVLIAGDTFRLDIQIEDPLQNTPTWALFVNGQELVTATNGVNLGSGLWRFDIAVPQAATPGKSARVRITATVDSSPWTRDMHSLVAAPVKLIEPLVRPDTTRLARMLSTLVCVSAQPKKVLV